MHPIRQSVLDTVTALLQTLVNAVVDTRHPIAAFRSVTAYSPTALTCVRLVALAKLLTYAPAMPASLETTANRMSASVLAPVMRLFAPDTVHAPNRMCVNAPRAGPASVVRFQCASVRMELIHWPAPASLTVSASNRTLADVIPNGNWRSVNKSLASDKCCKRNQR